MSVSRFIEYVWPSVCQISDNKFCLLNRLKHSVRNALMADGFAWNGTTYSRLSRIACVITGTRWNGPRFFGLRDKPAKGSSQ